MRKLIAGINMTLDGYCDHTAISPDEEIHDHYTQLIRDADTILYGRITFELMTFWQTLIKQPSGERSMDDFALAIDKISKIIFSHTLKDTDPIIIGWDSAKLSNKTLQEKVLELKQQRGNNILVGSRSLIIQLMNLNLIDEYQFCVHPVVAGKGLPLFENIKDRIEFTLLKTKPFGSGAVIFYYVPKNNNHDKN